MDGPAKMEFCLMVFLRKGMGGGGGLGFIYLSKRNLASLTHGR